jgi:hypothetical protein
VTTHAVVQIPDQTCQGCKQLYLAQAARSLDHAQLSPQRIRCAVCKAHQCIHRLQQPVTHLTLPCASSSCSARTSTSLCSPSSSAAQHSTAHVPGIDDCIWLSHSAAALGLTSLGLLLSLSGSASASFHSVWWPTVWPVPLARLQRCVQTTAALQLRLHASASFRKTFSHLAPAHAPANKLCERCTL